jgi:hypothetical protein
MILICLSSADVCHEIRFYLFSRHRCYGTAFNEFDRHPRSRTLSLARNRCDVIGFIVICSHTILVAITKNYITLSLYLPFFVSHTLDRYDAIKSIRAQISKSVMHLVKDLVDSSDEKAIARTVTSFTTTPQFDASTCVCKRTGKS